jgi:hypothetical protein
LALVFFTLDFTDITGKYAKKNELIGIAQLVTGIFHSINSDSGLNTMLVIKEASVFTVVLPVFTQFNSAKFSYTSTGHLH